MLLSFRPAGEIFFYQRIKISPAGRNEVTLVNDNSANCARAKYNLTCEINRIIRQRI